jgi:iron-sulfur cluster assembly protein
MAIDITDRALAQIEEVAREEDIDFEETVLRVAVVSGGCSGLTYDLGWDTTIQEDDEQQVVRDIPVVMDLKSFLYIDGSVLDFTDGLDGEGFHFKNPQASRTCACGESFAV